MHNLQVLLRVMQYDTEENNEMSHVLLHFRSCFYYSHDDLYRTKCPHNPRSQVPEQGELWAPPS